MVLSVCESFRYILHVHLLEYAALVGLDGIDRLAYIVGDIVHSISLCRQGKNLTLVICQDNLLALLPFMVI